MSRCISIKELRQVRELVEENRDFFLEKWYEQPRTYSPHRF